MSIKVTYNGDDIIDESASCTKVLKTNNTIMQDDVTVEYVAPPTLVLISKQIAANGEYDAEDDSADGYSSVAGNVPSDLEIFLTGQINYIKSNATFIAFKNYEASNTTYLLNVQFISFPNNTNIIISDFMRSTHFNTTLKYVNLGTPPASNQIAINNMAFFARTGLKSLIIGTKGVCKAQNNDAIDCLVRGIAYLYVPDLDSNGNDLPTQYKVATTWAAVADKIKGFSEAPAYDATTTYEIGDVCKYNNKFYGYCKKDLTSSTGNAPSGTTSDNDYWEYVADIEV